MSKLILFATYWNAIDWIDTSLEQIREINPDEAIICDGCFDLKREIHSTDGTLEKIIKFVDSNKNFQFTPPIRHNKCTGILKLFSYLALERSLIKILRPSNYNIIARAAIFCHHYRINQALTFNKMISMSKHWSPGNWFMTYDADQYYSNDLLCKFKNLESEHSDLVCAQELTFFHDFENFTTEYEKRHYNNMPHKIKTNTVIIPTRDIVLQDFTRFRHYYNHKSHKISGEYFHYKIDKNSRFNAGYELGDRRAPNTEKYTFTPLEIAHPYIIQNHLKTK